MSKTHNPALFEGNKLEFVQPTEGYTIYSDQHARIQVIVETGPMSMVPMIEVEYANYKEYFNPYNVLSYGVQSDAERLEAGKAYRN